MSKLYTEEQLRQVCQFVRGKNVDELIASLTPIELPTENEIRKEANRWKVGNEEFAFRMGVNWMRDKIKND